MRALECPAEMLQELQGSGIVLECEMDKGSVGFRGPKTLSLTLDLLLKNTKDTIKTKFFTHGF